MKKNVSERDDFIVDNQVATATSGNGFKKPLPDGGG
jgi:hypothetical protein